MAVRYAISGKGKAFAAGLACRASFQNWQRFSIFLANPDSAAEFCLFCRIDFINSSITLPEVITLLTEAHGGTRRLPSASRNSMSENGERGFRLCDRLPA
jgi:hypothetical protein